MPSHVRSSLARPLRQDELLFLLPVHEAPAAVVMAKKLPPESNTDKLPKTPEEEHESKDHLLPGNAPTSVSTSEIKAQGKSPVPKGSALEQEEPAKMLKEKKAAMDSKVRVSSYSIV